jgi:hypothetical protein
VLEVVVTLWWFQWRLQPLTIAGLANGETGSDLAMGASQISGPIEREYVISALADSGCQHIACLSLPSEHSTPLTRKGLFPSVSQIE